MADDSMRAELDQLRAQIAAQQAEMAALRRTVGTRRPRRLPRLSRRVLPLALVAVLMLLTPFSLLAANPFTDLVPGSVHNANIDAIYNAGVTTGCVPNAQYCPTDNVTRQEMASFLARLGGLGANPPVANAKTLGGIPVSGFVQEGSIATLGGLTVNGPVNVNGTIRTAFSSGTTNRATPIAYGFVNASGTLITGTPNITGVAKTATGQYQITIAGENFFFSSYITSATLGGSAGEIDVDSVSGKMVIETYNSAGTPTDNSFQFVVFKP